MISITEPDALGLAAAADPVSSYVVDLRLSDPARAQAFTSAHGGSAGPGPAAIGPGAGPGPASLVPWTGIAATDGLLIQDEQQVLSPGALLAALLAMASVAVLAGGRMAGQTRRTGLLEAVGGGIVAISTFHVTAGRRVVPATAGLGNPVIDRDEQMLLVLTVVLAALAVLNAACAAWSTVLDTRAASALVRALGATPRQVSAGIAAAQVIPAVPGALLGVPLGIELFTVTSHAGRVVVPPAWRWRPRCSAPCSRWPRWPASRRWPAPGGPRPGSSRPRRPDR